MHEPSDDLLNKIARAKEVTKEPNYYEVEPM
jgi:hypothetical protein